MRSRARAVPRIRRTARGNSYGMGKRAQDAVSGVYYPISEMIKQRGGLVSADPSEGSLDQREEIDPE